jgi:hypothetical protein
LTSLKDKRRGAVEEVEEEEEVTSSRRPRRKRTRTSMNAGRERGCLRREEDEDEVDGRAESPCRCVLLSLGRGTDDGEGVGGVKKREEKLRREVWRELEEEEERRRSRPKSVECRPSRWSWCRCCKKRDFHRSTAVCVSRPALPPPAANDGNLACLPLSGESPTVEGCLMRPALLLLKAKEGCVGG